MYQFSDSESKDSDEGIRFKTDSTRNKSSNVSSPSNRISNRRSQGSAKKQRRRSRSRSSDRRRRRCSRDRNSRDKVKIEKKRSHSSRSLSLSDEEVDRKKNPLRRKSSKHHRRRRSRSKQREVKQNDGRGCKVGNGEGDNMNANFQEASDDRTDPPGSPEIPENKDVILGPALPPHLLQQKTDETKTKVSTESESSSVLSALAQDKFATPCIGPSLPPDLQKTKEIEETATPQCIGPVLPSHLRKKLEEESQQVSNTQESEESDDVYGPLPPGMSSKTPALVALEERALQMKLDSLNPAGDQIKAREEWMLELPDVRARHIGLGPRQFRSRAGPDLSDRSAWTDTPKDKEEKAKTDKKEVNLKKENEMLQIQEHDKQQAEMIKKHKRKKGDKSLLEMHQAELKNKKDKDQDTNERRPFSREIDLKVNRFDEAQKKAIFKKAQLLDDRFSAGQSKFL